MKYETCILKIRLTDVKPNGFRQNLIFKRSYNTILHKYTRFGYQTSN